MEQLYTSHQREDPQLDLHLVLDLNLHLPGQVQEMPDKAHKMISQPVDLLNLLLAGMSEKRSMKIALLSYRYDHPYTTVDNCLIDCYFKLIFSVNIQVIEMF